MTKANDKESYSNLIFYAFAVAFFVLFIVNIFNPISNYKMIVLSVVSFLLSLQQSWEAKEEMYYKIKDFQCKGVDEDEFSKLRKYCRLPTRKYQGRKYVVIRSRIVFSLSIIIMIVGLTLDLNVQNTNLSNTLTIASFATIFATMGYKELVLTEVYRINEKLSEDNQRIIEQLKDQISNLEKQIGTSESSED